jgi:hypothetical protein
MSILFFSKNNYFGTTMPNISHRYGTPLGFKKYVMEPKGFIIYPNSGIACALSNFGHK